VINTTKSTICARRSGHPWYPLRRGCLCGSGASSTSAEKLRNLSLIRRRRKSLFIEASEIDGYRNLSGSIKHKAFFTIDCDRAASTQTSAKLIFHCQGTSNPAEKDLLYHTVMHTKGIRHYVWTFPTTSTLLWPFPGISDKIGTFTRLECEFTVNSYFFRRIGCLLIVSMDGIRIHCATRKP